MRIARMWLAVGVCALLAVSCEVSDDDIRSLFPGLQSTPEVESIADDIDPSSQSALAAIRERGEIRAGVQFSYPPFGRLNSRGELGGFSVDLVSAMADRWGVGVTYFQVTEQTAMPFLIDGAVDMVAAAMPHQREWHAFADFSQTVFRSGYLMAVPETSQATIGSMADLDGLTVGVVDQTASDVVKRGAHRADVEIAIEIFESLSPAVAAMLDGEVAAVVGRREELLLVAVLNPVGILNQFLQLEPYAIAVPRGDANLRNLVDITLQDMVNDGTYASLFRKHFFSFPADIIPVWPGDDGLTFETVPTDMPVAFPSRVELVSTGQALTVAGLHLDYDVDGFDGRQLLDGFNRAMVNEMARRWGVPLNELSDTGGERGTVLVGAGEADMAVGSVPERTLSAGADFSQSYLMGGLRLARLKGVGINRIEDLTSSRRVVVVNSPEGAALVAEMGRGADVTETESAEEALRLLQARDANAILADQFTISLIAHQDTDIFVVKDVFLAAPYAISVPRYDSDFRALVNFTLQDMRLDGTLAKLAEQYFSPYDSGSAVIAPLLIEVWPGSGDFLGVPAEPDN